MDELRELIAAARALAVVVDEKGWHMNSLEVAFKRLDEAVKPFDEIEV